MSQAQAATFNLTAFLDGAQANAGGGTGSSATGSASMTYDNVSGLFSWNISWTTLDGNVTVAHFHGPAQPGQNAGVQVVIDELNSPSSGSAMISAAQGGDLLAGLWYINIHSDLHPGGEIRGQVTVVPVPAAIWMMLSGLGALGLWRRR
ncbi:MAG: VPLPA-CTERM sorting domain-containing protein [Gammaproteobacteria bacterium]|nr:VPLPA-CTERM sorting domain-containing protein [Gammaproteobacteria bacterium]